MQISCLWQVFTHHTQTNQTIADITVQSCHTAPAGKLKPTFNLKVLALTLEYFKYHIYTITGCIITESIATLKRTFPCPTNPASIQPKRNPQLQ